MFKPFGVDDNWNKEKFEGVISNFWQQIPREKDEGGLKNAFWTFDPSLIWRMSIFIDKKKVLIAGQHIDLVNNFLVMFLQINLIYFKFFRWTLRLWLDSPVLFMKTLPQVSHATISISENLNLLSLQLFQWTFLLWTRDVCCWRRWFVLQIIVQPINLHLNFKLYFKWVVWMWSRISNFKKNDLGQESQ